MAERDEAQITERKRNKTNISTSPKHLVSIHDSSSLRVNNSDNLLSFHRVVNRLSFRFVLESYFTKHLVFSADYVLIMLALDINITVKVC